MSQAIQTILYLGGIQGVLLSIFLFSINTNKISNRLLGLLTLLWAIIVTSFALQAEGMYVQYPHLLKVFSPLLYALFPLLYLQVKYLISRHNRFEYADLKHFIPGIIIIILNLDFYFSGAEEKLLINRSNGTYYNIIGILGEEIIAIQGVVYSILALKLLNKYKRKIRDYLSNIDKMILKIQYSGIVLSLLAWIIGIIGIHLSYFHVDVSVDLFIFVYLILVLIIYIISYGALNSPEIFKLDKTLFKVNFLKNTQIKNSGIKNQNSPKVKTEVHEKTNQGIPIPNDEEIDNKLLKYIQDEKPYLNPELSLQELADKLEVTRHRLSRIINQHHNKNFFEYINFYRVEEVKSKMDNSENKHFKLISLAYDSGFNSKATFNRIFKQMTNMTPSQYFTSQQAD